MARRSADRAAGAGRGHRGGLRAGRYTAGRPLAKLLATRLWEARRPESSQWTSTLTQPCTESLTEYCKTREGAQAPAQSRRGLWLKVSELNPTADFSGISGAYAPGLCQSRVDPGHSPVRLARSTKSD